ncbi:DUF6795 domain-containing protein [Vibrio sp. B1FLJ16]|uniref:DUF6795 domain-containing protein n=1 Tax=Vibrio sp. B1FLJ16 TaxID=2751178 RepID=UPI0015F3B7FF|nr:DUF6795 domain-containing protein [Vibrio sp. B1FLJ16]
MKLSILFMLLLLFVFMGSGQLKGKENFKYTPNIHGVLKMHGAPIPHQKVILKVGFRGQIREFSDTTNEKGEFNFHSIQETKILSPSFLDQKYVVVFLKTNLDSGEEITIWESSIDGYEIDDFVRDNMANLTCEATDKLSYFAFSYSRNNEADTYVYSQCKLFGYVDTGIYEE